MRRNSLTYVFFVLLVYSSGALHAGAWVREKGKGFTAIEFTTYETASYWTRAGHRKGSNNKFKKLEYTSYWEYGITRKDTLIGKIWYANITESVNPPTNGFEDFELGWRRHLRKRGNTIYAAQLTTIIPAGPQNKPALRYSCFAAQLDIMLGRSFKFAGSDGFFDAALGYRMYHGFPSDQVRAHTILGYDLSKKVQVIGALFLEYGVFNGTPKMFNDTQVLTDPNYRLFKMELYGRYRFNKKFSLIAGFYHFLWGQNVGTNGGFKSALWIDF